MKKFLATILTLALALSCVPAALAAEPDDPPLTRGEALGMLLNAADDYNPGVQKSDILQGYPDGSLREEDGVTRLQALLMLGRAFGGLPEAAGAYAMQAYDTSSFADVPDWAEEELANVLQSGIVVGTSATTLEPDAPVTYEQMEIFIRRVYALEGSNLKDDFYSTVNHEYLIAAEPGSTSATTTLNLMTLQNMQNVIAQIQKIIETGGTTDGEKKIAVFYNNFIDWDGRNETGLAPIQSYLDAIDAATDAAGLLAVDVRIAEEQGSPVLLSFGVDTSREDSNTTVLTFTPYTPHLGKAGYASQYAEGAYQDFAATLFELSGMTPEEARRQARLCWDADIGLVEEMLSLQDAVDDSKTNNFRSFEELQALFPAADLTALLGVQRLKAEANVRVAEVDLMEACGALFQDENLDTMKALLRFGLLRNSSNYLTEDMYAAVQLYSMARSGQAADLSALGQEGLRAYLNFMSSEVIMDLMQAYVEQAYAAEYCSPEAKADVENMLRDLIATFRQRVEKLDWMDDATKEGAYRKLDNITLLVGYPEKWDSPVDHASILPLSEGGSAYRNWVEIQKARQAAVAEKQGKPVDRNEWSLALYKANAAYNFEQNSIEVLAGIMQAPVYDINASYEEKLGGLGYNLAHEITHAFDNIGANFDEDGNLNNWWTEEDYATFQALCQDVVKFYDGKEAAPGIACNGAQTFGESIADLGAVACITQLVSQREDPDLETLYRSVAKLWRSAATRDELENLRLIDTHALSPLRGQLPLQTCDEFYETFDITEGDGMWIPPEERVSIW